MYLKNIVIHGFKSFANKIKLEFHDGITAIVGPNGSGKSNIADAVRWVLGEQSAKTLRGSSMQDVIFSGSEARNPLGFAYVEITFDNSDHKLPVAYDEVSVSRRVYRSGESEYLINGTACRLKDIHELFMDTGIGKEGYSIIGQGQIDRILSTKPEDRRELFDEAAGIVKFKKRKQLAIANLVEASDNLLRITDIIRELEGQLGPLESQSITAKEYLRLRDELKDLEINAFLNDYDKFDSAKSSLEEKLQVVEKDLNDTKEANEKSREEYEKLETTLEDYTSALEEGREYKSQLLLDIEKKEGEIKLVSAQMLSEEENKNRINESTAGILMEIAAREDEEKVLCDQKKETDSKAAKIKADIAASDEELSAVEEEIKSGDELSNLVDEELAGIARDEALMRQNIERNRALTEQLNIRRSETSSKLLATANLEEESKTACKELKEKYDALEDKLSSQKKEFDEVNRKTQEEGDRARKAVEKVNELKQEETAQRSKLEMLTDITTRYEGYQNTVKKVMEMRGRISGIIGTVADLIEVDKKYETAVETALGASIQHIVVEDEQTAKTIIGELKREKLGRATFLPLTGIGRRNNKIDGAVFNEKGVIGDAYSLIGTAEKFNDVFEFLLRAFVVVDNIDNAIGLARKYDHNLRIVTLEGELLSPGGSIAGGSFKNSANLLGRKRQMVELEDGLKKIIEGIHEAADEYDRLNHSRQELKKKGEDIRALIGELSIELSAAKLNLEKEEQKQKEMRESAFATENEKAQLDRQIAEIAEKIKTATLRVEENGARNEELGEKKRQALERISQLKNKKSEALEKASTLKIEEANITQAGEYLTLNIERVRAEKAKLIEQKERSDETKESVAKLLAEYTEKTGVLRESIENDKNKCEELDKRIEELVGKKEKLTREHKSFFDSWEQLKDRIMQLEKEAFRLTNQKERICESIDAGISHIWDEYELTVTAANKFRNENFKASTARKDIANIKTAIKELGDVNVGAIEDFKTVSARYDLLSKQRDDLVESKASINEIINDLDDKMRKQFTEQLAAMNKEFDKVFKELFNGGRGAIELVEDEDVLDAGIRITAQPPGKKLQNMMMLSGGEKALTAIALLFAIQNLKPSPFCLLDEIEAALDDSNVGRFAGFLKKLIGSQFIVITHRRGTMACADVLYGITMQEKGVSTLVSVSMIENDLSK